MDRNLSCTHPGSKLPVGDNHPGYHCRKIMTYRHHRNHNLAALRRRL